MKHHLAFTFSFCLILSQPALADPPGKLVLEHGRLNFKTLQGNYPAQVTEAQNSDFDFIVRLNHEAYPQDNPTLKNSEEWVTAHWGSRSRGYSRYYVLSYMNLRGESIPIAYALWALEKGYKPEATLRLEQLTIESQHRKKIEKIGTAIARLSLEQFREDVLKPQGISVKVIYTFIGSRNFTAFPIYEKVLGLRSRGKVGVLFPVPHATDQEILLLNEDVERFLKENPIETLLRI